MSRPLKLMWLDEFRGLYGEVIHQLTGRPQDLAQVEANVQRVFARAHNRVDGEVLREVGSGWSYGTGWHELSPVVDLPVELMEGWARENRDGTIESLLLRLKHIEVVSVVL